MYMSYCEKGKGLLGYEELNCGKTKKAKYRHYGSKKDMFSIKPEFNGTVVTMSDLHSVSFDLIKKMVKSKYIKPNSIVIMTGDMAGTGKLGPAGDADPYQLYQYMLENCASLYFVQGNHDIKNSEVYNLKNPDGTPCCVSDVVIDTPIGRIGGLDGIISKQSIPDRHKYLESEYLKRYKRVKDMKPEIMLTHQPPAEQLIFAPVHLFGHAHTDNYNKVLNGCTCLNMDSRVFIFS